MVSSVSASFEAYISYDAKAIKFVVKESFNVRAVGGSNPCYTGIFNNLGYLPNTRISLTPSPFPSKVSFYVGPDFSSNPGKSCFLYNTGNSTNCNFYTDMVFEYSYI